MWKEEGKKPIIEYLVWTFLISWGIEGLIVLLERANVLPATAQKAVVMILIGFGAGLAPAYAVFIILKRHHRIHGWKEFFQRIILCEHAKSALIVWSIMITFELVKCIVTEDWMGNPWYCFILYLPLMVFGGGAEEIGWRGFLQPTLEGKFGFVIATLMQGSIWAIWHLPLWLVQNANQRNFHFIAFAMYCMAFSFALALLYRFTKSVLFVILLHAWGNVVLGGMYSYHALENLPGRPVLLFYAVEIIAAIAIEQAFSKYTSTQQLRNTERITDRKRS